MHPVTVYGHAEKTTTGPLGQGVATSVGMAIAEQWLRATYKSPGLRDRCVSGEKVLCMMRRFEPLHLSLSAPRRQM